MTPPRWVVAAVGVIVVAASFATGRLTAPDCPKFEFDHSQDVIAQKAEKDAGATATQTATAEEKTRDQVRTVIRYVREPGGREERTETRVETHDQAATRTLETARAVWEYEANAAMQETMRKHAKEIAAARTDWSVSVLAGVNFGGGMVTRRIVGPVEAGAVVIVAPEKIYAGAALALRW